MLIVLILEWLMVWHFIDLYSIFKALAVAKSRNKQYTKIHKVTFCASCQQSL